MAGRFGRGAGVESRIWGHNKNAESNIPVEVIKNEENGRSALLVDAQSIESTYTEEFTGNEDGTTLITPSSGNKIIIKDVFITINDPGIGEVALDFSDNGDKIARLYGSQFSRASFSNLTKKGEVGQSVELTGDASGSGDKIFVIINYIEVVGDE